ncbi:diguanylate phosphodiesterase [Pantoea sp. 1.19]|uniref:diguanylate phosphodiesterase n=1 Tax=Pantoea sp. 1.19 TaxID=1925589 RepID=UPI0009491512|nr:diguanylate phosphodiesterase [Pantoea sp. 1.19]
MLSTLIYRSHICENVPFATLDDLASSANARNEVYDVTGILLFNGTHFFQLLEGPEESVNAIYSRICDDPRHHNLVELLRDYAPARRFGNVGMELFNLTEHDGDEVLQAVLDKGTSKYQLTYNDRALQFLRTFVEATEREHYFELPPAESWRFVEDDSPQRNGDASLLQGVPCQFAFQPILDPLSQSIVALEALIRSPDGNTPDRFFAGLSQEEIPVADLHAKKLAFAQAKRLGIGERTLAINLSPLSLVAVPGAVDFLLHEIHAQGLVPEQIVVEVSEREVIARQGAFAAAIKQLKAAGMRLAIDDFGAGSAGLLLLTQVQPDRIKINRHIISDVHKSGPKQAIVRAILQCCASLEIQVIANGVEKVEEWMWLESAGIAQFQGFLFARPAINAIPAVNWPELADTPV